MSKNYLFYVKIITRTTSWCRRPRRRRWPPSSSPPARQTCRCRWGSGACWGAGCGTPRWTRCRGCGAWARAPRRSCWLSAGRPSFGHSDRWIGISIMTCFLFDAIFYLQDFIVCLYLKWKKVKTTCRCLTWCGRDGTVIKLEWDWVGLEESDDSWWCSTSKYLSKSYYLCNML